MDTETPILMIYHAARSLEELEIAEAATVQVVRQSHMELSRLHLNQAGMLRGSDSVQTVSPSHSIPSCILDMGEASREEGFRLNGCR
jgi:hypothetical protein